mmetsp:Transcript_14705/g.14137  ORF Transcript_14705/g.14137 Transcript_14705/m.14137 type:complete len:346 (-) Transcript_14705:11-1048(-)
MAMYFTAVSLSSIFLITCKGSKQVSSYVRPPLITQALESNSNVYYLGVGSNLLKEKVVNRGANGSTISFISFGAARVDDHRLAFNMRGFLPLEPSMGGIEECKGSCCHGALMEMTATEYQKIWMSEGGGQADPGYQEVIVTAFPYGSEKSVQAIVLQTAKRMKLLTDAPPSARYMDIIIKGATELNLSQEYIDNLKAIPIVKVPKHLIYLSKKNYFFLGFLFRKKLRFVTTFYSKLLWAFHYKESSRIPFLMATAVAAKLEGENLIGSLEKGGRPVGRVSKVGSPVAAIRTLFSNFMTTIIILPGALIGLAIEASYTIQGKTPPGIFGQVAKPQPITPPVTAVAV